MIPFLRMNGLGNVFAVIDVRGGAAPPSPDRIRTLASAKDGIGFDQFIIIARGTDGADATMRIFNADGGEVGSCGNAARCVADLLLRERNAAAVSLASAGGVMRGWRAGDEIAVDMGVARFAADEIPITPGAGDPSALVLEGFEGLGAARCVNVGNPHAVFDVADPSIVALDEIGPALEHHPVFPLRANISFVAVHAPDRVTARVWERGAGATKACGTAACAIAAIGHRAGELSSNVIVALPGGTLTIAVENGRIIMSGPAALDWTGVITDDSWHRTAP